MLKFSSEYSFNIFLEAAARSLKNIEMFPGAATHLPQHKKYQLHIFFHGFYTKYIQKQLHNLHGFCTKCTEDFS